MSRHTIHYTRLILVLLLAGSCSCGSNIEPARFNLPEQATHELREVFLLDGPTEGIFFDKIWNVLLLKNSNLIVQNYFETELFELSPEGALVNIIGREGG